MIRRINYLPTPTSLPGETGMFRIISTYLFCVPGGIWLISMAFRMFSRKGICLVTIFTVYLSRIYMGDMYNQYSVTGVGSVRSTDLYIFNGVRSVRSAWSVHTCLSVGVIDLHDLYHLQEDLYDLRDFCMAWRICKIWILYTCSHHVYRARVCMRWIFHRFVPEWDLCNLCIFTGLDLYDLQVIYLRGICVS